jgi:hypothetical protein
MSRGERARVAAMADFELRREIEAGGYFSEDAADELAARIADRAGIRPIDPQARLAEHHSDFGSADPTA